MCPSARAAAPAGRPKTLGPDESRDLQAPSTKKPARGAGRKNAERRQVSAGAHAGGHDGPAKRTVRVSRAIPGNPKPPRAPSLLERRGEPMRVRERERHRDPHVEMAPKRTSPPRGAPTKGRRSSRTPPSTSAASTHRAAQARGAEPIQDPPQNDPHAKNGSVTDGS